MGRRGRCGISGYSRAIVKLGWLAGAAVSVALLVGAAAAKPASNAGFFVGFSEDIPRAIGTEATTPARDLGASAFRLTLQWASGQTRVADTEIASLRRGITAAAGMKVVLAVYAHGANATHAPQTDAARVSTARMCATRSPGSRPCAMW